MKTKFFLFAGLMAACLTSCSETDEFADGKNGYGDDGKGIKIEVTDEFAHAATRAAYDGFPATTFEEGDEIGVYAFNGSSYVNSNVKFTRQSDGSWTPASTVVYNPDYTYYAYFPWRSSTYSVNTSGTVDAVDTKFSNFISDGSNYFWKTDQSTKANFTYSNLMIAKGIVTGTRTVKFTMQHKRGLAIIGNALNKWSYTDGGGTKYELSQVFSGNIPYEIGGTKYYLLKPNTTTSVGGLSLRASAGHYMTSVGGEITGTPTYTYSTSNNLGSSWGGWTSTKPGWLTITTNTVDGEPTEFLITTTNSNSTSTSKGMGMARTVSGDATLKAASPVSNVDLSMVNNDGSARASRTTANCYLVHAAGTYKLPLVYGNAIKNGATNESAYYTTQTSNTLQRLVNHNNTGITDPWIKTVVGSTPDGAELVWEDVQGMISSVGIDGDYLTFTVDNSNIAEGNAVVAAKLGSTIVWSWHIWVTPQTLSETTEIATGSHTYQVAPVNVGQVDGLIKANATIYAGDLCKVRATANGITVEFQVTAKDYMYGGSNYYNPSPYYQWGRKDAMYSCVGGFNSSGVLSQNPTVVTGANSIGTTLQNPDKHYYNSSTAGPYNETKYNYWDMNQTSTGNITTATVKTVYDPCPPGFCVPTGNLYYYMGNTGGSNSSYGSWQSSYPRGRIWIYGGANLFFPASGYRINSIGSLSIVGNYGYYWSASAFSSSSGHYLYFDSGNWYWNNFNRASGYPVRAVVEE